MYRKIILTICIVLVTASLGFAATVSLEWDANKETDLFGYRLYQSNSSGQYTKGQNFTPVPIGPVNFDGKVTYTTPDLDPGKYFWVVTAIDNAGNESEFSLEEDKTIVAEETLGQPGRPTPNLN